MLERATLLSSLALGLVGSFTPKPGWGEGRGPPLHPPAPSLVPAGDLMRPVRWCLCLATGEQEC